VCTTIPSVTISGAAGAGGAYIAANRASATVELVGTLVRENASTSGGGGAAYLTSWWGNAVSFVSTGCDFGASGSADDNAPSNVFIYGGASHNYGDAATFACSARGCL